MNTNNSSPSSASSEEENYYSAAEYVSPYKDSGTPTKGSSESEHDLADTLNALNEASHEAMEFVNRCASFDPPLNETETGIGISGTKSIPPKIASATTNPWSDMKAIAENLESSRSRIDKAWRNARAVHERLTGETGEEDDDCVYESDDEDEQNDNEFDDIDFTVPVNLDMETTIGEGVDIGDDCGEFENTEGDAKESHDGDGMPADQFRARYTEMMTETFGDDLEEIHQQGDNAVDVNVLVGCLQSGINVLQENERNRKSFFDSLGYDENGDESMKGNNSGTVEEPPETVHQLRQHRLGYLVGPKE